MQFEINKHLLRPQIALTLRTRTILLVFKKIYSCLFIPNYTWNHVITYTKLHETNFNYHFLTSILDGKIQSLNTRSFSAVQVFYWSSKMNWFVKSCKICLSFSCNLINFFKQAFKFVWLLCLSKAVLLAEKKDAMKSIKWCDLWLNRTVVSQSAWKDHSQVVSIWM